MDLKIKFKIMRDWLVFETPDLSSPTILRTFEGLSGLIKVFLVLPAERSNEAKKLQFDALILLM